MSTRLRYVVIYLIVAGSFLLGIATKATFVRAEDPVPAPLPSFEWERFPLPTNGESFGLRTRTPEGWLVYVGDCAVYVPDPQNRWLMGRQAEGR